MITITRKLARQLRRVFSKSLQRTFHNSTLLLTFQTGNGGLVVRATTDSVAIEYQDTELNSETNSEIIMSLDVLKQCEGSTKEPVILKQQDNQVLMEWSDDNKPQQVLMDVVTPKSEFPPVPKTMIANEPRLLQAIKDAVETVECGASRYALECLQLREKNGQIAATDSRQLLVQKGFKFPWKNDILVPANKVFACRDILSSKQVEVGSTEDWFCLQTEQWTIHIRLEKDARFPNVDTHIPNPKNAVATLHLAKSDEKFLKQSLKNLPNRDKLTSSVTIDLNGEVLLRSRGEHLSDTHELLLTNSTKSGEDICINTDRNYLARAIKLGFRNISLFGEETPIACIEKDRIYLWAVLESTDITPSSTKPQRITSPVDPSTSPSKRSTKRTMKKSSTRSKPNIKQNGQVKETETNETTSLIYQAEALRDSLQNTLTLSRNLITDLKKQKKQSRLMQTTINSLRQLQTIDL